MAVLPQFGGLAEAQMRALMRDYGALLSAAGNNGCQQYNNCAAGVVSAAQSELTCNGGGGCGGVGLPSRRKRGREAGMEQYVSSPSSALLPVPGMLKEVAVLSPTEAAGMASRTVDPVRMMTMASTSGRTAVGNSVADDALVAELCRQGAEVDALVRAECERMRAGMEHARKRQRQAVVRAVAGVAERRLRETGARLDAALRRAAELEERVRQAAAESAAWRGLARSHEAVAAGLRATLDRVLLLPGGGYAAPVEGFGESDPAAPSTSAAAAAADDALSRCCFESTDVAPRDAATSSAGKWACRACGEGEASVLLLPCRHLCLCKACEPWLDACPVCLAVKNTSIHVSKN